MASENTPTMKIVPRFKPILPCPSNLNSMQTLSFQPEDGSFRPQIQSCFSIGSLSLAQMMQRYLVDRYEPSIFRPGSKAGYNQRILYETMKKYGLAGVDKDTNIPESFYETLQVQGVSQIQRLKLDVKNIQYELRNPGPSKPWTKLEDDSLDTSDLQPLQLLNQRRNTATRDKVVRSESELLDTNTDSNACAAVVKQEPLDDNEAELIRKAFTLTTLKACGSGQSIKEEKQSPSEEEPGEGQLTDKHSNQLDSTGCRHEREKSFIEIKVEAEASDGEYSHASGLKIISDVTEPMNEICDSVKPENEDKETVSEESASNEVMDIHVNNFFSTNITDSHEETYSDMVEGDPSDSEDSDDITNKISSDFTQINKDQTFGQEDTPPHSNLFFVNHFRLSDFDKNKPEDTHSERLMKCYLCPLKCRAGETWAHIQSVHMPDPKPSQAKPETEKTILKPKRSTKQFSCTHCFDNSFSCLRNAKFHEQLIHVTGVSCYFCGLSLKTRDDGLVHLVKCHAKCYQCDCHETFSKVSDFIRHIAHSKHPWHEPDDMAVYTCIFCSKTFSEEKACISHIKVGVCKDVHFFGFTSSQQSCSSCSFPFLDREALEFHQNKHANLPEFAPHRPYTDLNKFLSNVALKDRVKLTKNMALNWNPALETKRFHVKDKELWYSPRLFHSIMRGLPHSLSELLIAKVLKELSEKIPDILSNFYLAKTVLNKGVNVCQHLPLFQDFMNLLQSENKESAVKDLTDMQETIAEIVTFILRKAMDSHTEVETFLMSDITLAPDFLDLVNSALLIKSKLREATKQSQTRPIARKLTKLSDNMQKEQTVLPSTSQSHRPLAAKPEGNTIIINNQQGGSNSIVLGGPVNQIFLPYQGNSHVGTANTLNILPYQSGIMNTGLQFSQSMVTTTTQNSLPGSFNTATSPSVLQNQTSIFPKGVVVGNLLGGPGIASGASYVLPNQLASNVQTTLFNQDIAPKLGNLPGQNMILPFLPVGQNATIIPHTQPVTKFESAAEIVQKTGQTSTHVSVAGKEQNSQQTVSSSVVAGNDQKTWQASNSISSSGTIQIQPSTRIVNSAELSSNISTGAGIAQSIQQPLIFNSSTGMFENSLQPTVVSSQNLTTVQGVDTVENTVTQQAVVSAIRSSLGSVLYARSAAPTTVFSSMPAIVSCSSLVTSVTTSPGTMTATRNYNANVPKPHIISPIANRPAASLKSPILPRPRGVPQTLMRIPLIFVPVKPQEVIGDTTLIKTSHPEITEQLFRPSNNDSLQAAGDPLKPSIKLMPKGSEDKSKSMEKQNLKNKIRKKCSGGNATVCEMAGGMRLRERKSKPVYSESDLDLLDALSDDEDEYIDEDLKDTAPNLCKSYTSIENTDRDWKPDISGNISASDDNSDRSDDDSDTTVDVETEPAYLTTDTLAKNIDGNTSTGDVIDLEGNTKGENDTLKTLCAQVIKKRKSGEADESQTVIMSPRADESDMKKETVGYSDKASSSEIKTSLVENRKKPNQNFLDESWSLISTEDLENLSIMEKKVVVTRNGCNYINPNVGEQSEVSNKEEESELNKTVPRTKVHESEINSSNICENAFERTLGENIPESNIGVEKSKDIDVVLDYKHGTRKEAADHIFFDLFKLKNCYVKLKKSKMADSMAEQLQNCKNRENSCARGNELKTSTSVDHTSNIKDDNVVDDKKDTNLETELNPCLLATESCTVKKKRGRKRKLNGTVIQNQSSVIGTSSQDHAVKIPIPIAKTASKEHKVKIPVPIACTPDLGAVQALERWSNVGEESAEKMLQIFKPISPKKEPIELEETEAMVNRPLLGHTAAVPSPFHAQQASVKLEPISPEKDLLSEQQQNPLLQIMQWASIKVPVTSDNKLPLIRSAKDILNERLKAKTQQEVDQESSVNNQQIHKFETSYVQQMAPQTSRLILPKVQGSMPLIQPGLTQQPLTAKAFFQQQGQPLIQEESKSVPQSKACLQQLYQEKKNKQQAASQQKFQIVQQKALLKEKQQGQRALKKKGKDFQQLGRELLQKGQALLEKQQQGQAALQQQGQNVQQLGQALLQKGQALLEKQQQCQAALKQQCQTVQQKGQALLVKQQGQTGLQQQGQPIIQLGQTLLQHQSQSMLQPQGQLILKQEGQAALQHQGQKVQQLGQTLLQHQSQSMLQPQGQLILKQEGQAALQQQGQIVQQQNQLMMQPGSQIVIQHGGQAVLQQQGQTFQRQGQILQTQQGQAVLLQSQTSLPQQAQAVSQQPVQAVSQQQVQAVSQQQVQAVSQQQVQAVSQQVQAVSQQQIQAVSQQQVQAVSQQVQAVSQQQVQAVSQQQIQAVSQRAHAVSQQQIQAVSQQVQAFSQQQVQAIPQAQGQMFLPQQFQALSQNQIQPFFLQHPQIQMNFGQGNVTKYILVPVAQTSQAQPKIGISSIANTGQGQNNPNMM